MPEVSQELKPCPFCGGEAEIEQKGDRRQSTIYTCLECGCRLETGEEFNHGKSWNTRTPSPSIPGEVEKLRELSAKATQGPWEVRSNRFLVTDAAEHDVAFCGHGGGREDAAFIAASVNFIREMLASLTLLERSSSNALSSEQSHD